MWKVSTSGEGDEGWGEGRLPGGHGRGIKYIDLMQPQSNNKHHRKGRFQKCLTKKLLTLWGMPSQDRGLRLVDDKSSGNTAPPSSTCPCVCARACVRARARACMGVSKDALRRLVATGRRRRRKILFRLLSYTYVVTWVVVCVCVCLCVCVCVCV